ncbi:hypothetical protein [Herbiconiux daphne]|uniref:Integral membrane protein n=1 Tax=Herbiconiux daphne TaxID=2970914 RepID=A0ABT2H1V6_9MICO|nr:hypothetical protein [Herbiconiux daphne]MCS5733887.1 hypothetical protein [Herbiconiux daphne]
MAGQTNAELVRRLEALEAENAALRQRVDAQPTLPLEPLGGTGGGPSGGPSGAPLAAAKKKRGWGWTLLATVLIVIGAVLAPLAVAASWSKVVLTDTESFVATYAPLADDPRVQAYITDQTVIVINEQVDIPKLTADVIDGITGLGTGPAATRALELLKGPAASGIQSLIQSGVSGFVESDAFADVWTSALRISHAQLVAVMQNDPNAAVTLGGDGSIGIQLGPIIEAVKSALIAQGIDFASQIPAIDRTIVVAQSDALPTVQLAYGLAVSAGAWLPWIALLFLAAGVVVSRRRSVALIWAAVALALVMALTAAAFAVGSLVFVSSVSPALLPGDVAGLLYETVAGDMRTTAVAVLVLAIVVAVVAWLAGPFDVPRRLRRFAAEGAGRIRGAAERRGITTGRVGEWLYAQRVLLRVVVAAIGAAIVLFLRPLTPALTIWTLVLAGVVLAVLEIVQRPVITVPANAEGDVPVVSVE